jgi:hypothetical protein
MTEPESTSSEMEERSANVSDADANAVRYHKKLLIRNIKFCSMITRLLSDRHFCLSYGLQWIRRVIISVSNSLRTYCNSIRLTVFFHHEIHIDSK